MRTKRSAKFTIPAGTNSALLCPGASRDGSTDGIFLASGFIHTIEVNSPGADPLTPLRVFDATNADGTPITQGKRYRIDASEGGLSGTLSYEATAAGVAVYDDTTAAIHNDLQALYERASYPIPDSAGQMEPFVAENLCMHGMVIALAASGATTVMDVVVTYTPLTMGGDRESQAARSVAVLPGIIESADVASNSTGSTTVTLTFTAPLDLPDGAGAKLHLRNSTEIPNGAYIFTKTGASTGTIEVSTAPTGSSTANASLVWKGSQQPRPVIG